MITMKQVTFQYPNQEEAQLKDVTLNFSKGKVILIAGKSGCGKTTLASCINGIIPYFHEGELSGEITVNGQNTKELSISEIGEKVGSVFQDPRTQFFTTNTTEEVAFGCHNMGMSKDEIQARVRKSFQMLHIEELKNRSIFELSSGEKQKIAIASAYSMSPQVFLFDEPSANLDPKAVYELARMIQTLKEQGHTIIILEHRIYFLRQLVDEVIYMKDGRVEKVIQGDVAFVSFLHQNTGLGLRKLDLLEAEPKKEELRFVKDKEVLHVKNLSVSYRKKHKEVLKGVNLTVREGEIVGMVGENGAGKTTLAKTIVGLMKASGGEIRLNGRICKEKERIRQSYFVMQESDYQLFSESVKQELLLGSRQKEETLNQAIPILQELGLSDCLERHPASLSRGQKQRLTIGAALLSDAEFIVFDEPTSGLDGERMEYVTNLLLKLAKRGKSLLIISHDYEFLVNCCDRIAEVKDGVIKHDFDLSSQTLPTLQKLVFGKELINS